MNCPNIFSPHNKMSSAAVKCHLPPRYIDIATQAAFRTGDGRRKRPVKPVAIITFGPTGSGKSKILEMYLKTIGKGHFSSDIDNFVEINVDTLVEAIPEYTRLVSSTASPKERTNAYFACRGEVDELSSLIFEKAISGHYNLVYETTGWSTTWLKGDLAKLKGSGYIIVLLFPLVTWKILNERLDKREQIAPRKIDRTDLRIGVKNAIQNFFGVLDFVDHAYIYDNSGSADIMNLLLEYDGTITPEKSTRVVKCHDKELDRYLRAESEADFVQTIQTYIICKACAESAECPTNRATSVTK